MNITLDTDLGFSHYGIDDIFLICDEDNGYHSPLLFKEAIGHYTMNPQALYCARSYKLGIRVNNIDLHGKLNQYVVELTHGTVTQAPYYNADLNMLIVNVKFNESERPTLDPLSLPESLWTNCAINVYVNDIAVPTTDKNTVTIPLSFNINGSTASGESFFNSEQAVMVIQPGETVFIDICSGGGGGAGLNLIKGENQSGENGGDATLCYVEPETNEIKPIVFLEGGLGGRLSSHAHQEFKPRECKVRVFNEGKINANVFIETIVRGHNTPINNIISSIGGGPHSLLNGGDCGEGGKGGIKDEIGFRGEGGFSGGRAIVQIQYSPFMNSLPGPFLIVHPRTMVNIFGIIKDKDLKIKKTKQPMIGGAGGESLTVNGEDGQSGKMTVSI